MQEMKMARPGKPRRGSIDKAGGKAQTSAEPRLPNYSKRDSESDREGDRETERLSKGCESELFVNWWR